MKRFVQKLFLFIIIFFFLFSCIKDDDKFTIKEGVLTVGMEIGYPPMEYFDQNGNPAGFDVSLANAIGDKLGLKIEFIDTAWDVILQGLNSRRYDCVISSVTILPERIEKYNISKPYVHTSLAVIVPRNFRRRISSPKDLGGLRVAFQEATTAEYFLDNLAEEGLRFTPYAYDKVMRCFDELLLGRVDAVFTDTLVAYEYLSRSAFFEIAWHGSEEEFGIVLKKDNDVLTEAINNALDELFEDGTMLELSMKYFNGADMVTAVRR